MPAVTLTVDDLRPFAPDIDEAKAQAMIEDAMAKAARVAPCIMEPGFEHDQAARATLRRVILRWNDEGTGALTQRQQTAGSFSLGETYDTRQPRRAMFWPSEIKELQELCGATRSGAFTIDQGQVQQQAVSPLSTRPDLWFQHAWGGNYSTGQV